MDGKHHGVEAWLTCMTDMWGRGRCHGVLRQTILHQHGGKDSTTWLTYMYPKNWKMKVKKFWMEKYEYEISIPHKTTLKPKLKKDVLKNDGLCAAKSMKGVIATLLKKDVLKNDDRCTAQSMKGFITTLFETPTLIKQQNT